MQYWAILCNIGKVYQFHKALIMKLFGELNCCSVFRSYNITHIVIVSCLALIISVLICVSTMCVPFFVPIRIFRHLTRSKVIKKNRSNFHHPGTKQNGTNTLSWNARLVTLQLCNFRLRLRLWHNVGFGLDLDWWALSGPGRSVCQFFMVNLVLVIQL